MDRTQSPLRIAALAMLLVAAGCGGSDPSGPVPLGTSNAELAAGQTVEMAAMMTDMGELVEGFTRVFESPSAALLPCDRGAANFSVNDTNLPGEMSTGDSANLGFEACEFGEGEAVLTLDGTITLDVVEVTSSGPGSRSATIDVAFDGLTVTAGGAVVGVDGGWRMTMAIEDDVVLSATVSGERFRLFLQAAGRSFSATLTDFEHTRTWNTATDAYSWSAAWTLQSSVLGGSVTLVTHDEFLGALPAPPDTGSLTLTGADGATVTLIALDSENVRLVIDTGTQTTIDTTWDALSNP